MEMTFEQAIAELRHTDRTLVSRAKSEAMELMREAAKMASENAPFESGHLSERILASPKVEVQGNTVIGSWGSDVEYDAFQEYGTGVRGAEGAQGDLSPGWQYGDIPGISPSWHHRQAHTAIAPAWERVMMDVASPIPIPVSKPNVSAGSSRGGFLARVGKAAKKLFRRR